MIYLNVIINNNSLPTDREGLFPGDEIVTVIQDGDLDIYDLLVLLGSFPSKSKSLALAF